MNSVIELIERIKPRPAMYLGRNSISCLKAFIDGWFLRDINTVTDSWAMNSFQEWIEKKYDISRSHSWCDIILFHSQDESTAMVNFFKDFDDWKSSHPRPE